MLLTIFLTIAGAFMNFFYGIFASIGLQGWHLPQGIVNGLALIFSTFAVWNNILPFSADIISIISILAVVYIIMYKINILRWFWGLIPIIGTYHNLPGTKQYNSESKSDTVKVLDSKGREHRVTTTSSRRWMK